MAGCRRHEGWAGGDAADYGGDVRIVDVRVRLGIVGDEESEEEVERGSDHLVYSGLPGRLRDHRPADLFLHIGVEAKGVLALRVTVEGTAAHGATWRGDACEAIDVFPVSSRYRSLALLEALRSRLRLQPRCILGGDALNKVPDRCAIDVDILADLPLQDPADLLAQVKGIPAAEVEQLFTCPPAVVDRELPDVAPCATRPPPITTASR